MKILNKKVIRYVIAGVLTTLISILSYNIFRNVNINYEVSTILSWIVAVIFAYYINSRFVFQNRNNSFKDFFKFVLCRLLSLGIDLLCMYILVDIISINDRIAKVLVQGIVFVLNYLFSKLIVFKK